MIEAAWLVKPVQGSVIFDTQVCSQHVVKIKHRPAARKTACVNLVYSEVYIGLSTHLKLPKLFYLKCSY